MPIMHYSSARTGVNLQNINVFNCCLKQLLNVRSDDFRQSSKVPGASCHISAILSLDLRCKQDFNRPTHDTLYGLQNEWPWMTLSGFRPALCCRIDAYFGAHCTNSSWQGRQTTLGVVDDGYFWRFMWLRLRKLQRYAVAAPEKFHCRGTTGAL